MQGSNTCPNFTEESSGSSRTKSTVKRRSTRSRVWDKVAWFTKKGKGGKENVACKEEQSPEIELKNTSVGERRRANRHKDVECEKLCQGTFNENSLIKDKRRGGRKPGSFRYLKKRKARQLNHDSSDGPSEEITASSSQLPDTATGTFHDFTSERVRTRQGSNTVLNEIARGMQRSSSDCKGNVQSVMSLPLGDTSLHGSIKRSESLKHHDSVVVHKSGPSLWRSWSFSSPSYNSWPRKKRTSLGSLSVGVLSPPQKQKRMSGLKKTATFSGFDSSRFNIKDACHILFKGVKSTPNGSQIKNQDGSTVGIIHCVKSPKDNRSSNTSSQHAKQPAHLPKSSKSSEPEDPNLEPACGKGCDSMNANHHDSQLFEECPKDSPQQCPEFMCVEAGNSAGITLPSCEILGTRLLDSYNHDVYNVTTLSRVSESDNSARGSWSDNQDELSMITDDQNHTMTKFSRGELSDSTVEPSVEHKGITVRETYPTDEQQNWLKAGDKVPIKKAGMPVNTPVISCSSLSSVTDLHTTLIPELPSLSATVMHISCPPCLDNGKQSVGCQTELTSPSSINVTDTLCTFADMDIVDENCFPESSSVLRPFSPGGCGEGELCGNVENGSAMSEKQGQDVESLTAWSSQRPAVNGRMFKQNMEVILQYFHEFSDEQKNIMIKKLLGHCGVPQMHMLSVSMEPILHQSCPPNCQDVLAWLPASVASNVLSYVDAVSLCRCDQVNKLWHNLASNPVLWKRLCRIPFWQLSRSSEEKQLLKYRSADGTTQWKKVLAERFLLRKNWLSGSFEVRTFKGHTQGISCVQFDDSRIASGSSDKTIKVWDMKSDDSNAVLTLAGHSGTVRCLNLNGNRLVSGSVDRSIKVWDLSFESYWSGASCKVTMIGHMHTVRCLQVDDEKVVSGSYDKTLKVWDIKTGQCCLTLRGHNAAVLCVQFDDKKIVSGSYDKTIKVWSLDEGSCLMTLTGHHDAVTCLNLTFDSRKVISGSLDHNLKFWDLATGKSIGTLDWIRSEGHTGVVRCLQSDSWRIVSAGDDKTMKMWSLETGQRLLTLRCHTDGVTCLQFNDFRIVSGSYDQTVKLWNFAPSHDFLFSE